MARLGDQKSSDSLPEGSLNRVLAAIRSRYRDLEQPTFEFVESEYRDLRRSDFLWSFVQRWYVKDETDLNDHVALHLRIRDQDHGREVLLCLSFVGPFCMLFRLSDSGLFEAVLTEMRQGLCEFEIAIIRLCRTHKWQMIDGRCAATPIPIRLPTTSLSETRVYHALFSDEGVVPTILLCRNELP